VFGVFLGVGAFFFALVRAYAPKLALFSVFGYVTGLEQLTCASHNFLTNCSTVFLDVICVS